RMRQMTNNVTNNSGLVELDNAAIRDIILYGDMVEAVWCMHTIRGFTVTPFHLNIIRALCNDDPFGLILAPRGFGKTEVVNSWLCVVGLRNRNIRILVTSRTDNQIKAIGNNIRKTYTSEAFTRIFGN